MGAVGNAHLFGSWRLLPGNFKETVTWRFSKEARVLRKLQRKGLLRKLLLYCCSTWDAPSVSLKAASVFQSGAVLVLLRLESGDEPVSFSLYFERYFL